MKKIIKVHDLKFEPFLLKTTIHKRVKELAEAIRNDFAGKKPLFLGVLNGAFIFAADLIRASGIDSETAFVKLSSYRGLKSSGEVNTVFGLDMNVKDRHLIILEDIIDSGHTLYDFLPKLEKLEPASISLGVLLLKPDVVKYPFKIDYLGFEIPNKFVVGYGLDYNGLGRHLEDIYQLVE